MSQNCTAVDHKPNTMGRGKEIQGRKEGLIYLYSVVSVIQKIIWTKMSMTIVMVLIIMIVSSLNHHNIKKIPKHYSNFKK